MTVQNTEQFQKWQAWLDSINLQVQLLVVYRRIFTEVLEIVEGNSAVDKDNIYFGFVSNAYVDSVVMGIRRQLKTDKQSISVARLLKEIADNSQVITRSLFERQYMAGASQALQESPGVRAAMEDVFAKYAARDSEFIDPNLVLEDISGLKSICQSAEDYADKRIAHWDMNHPMSNLTFDDINDALNQLCTIVQKYYLLLFGTHLFMTPALPHPISELFQTAWLNSDSRPSAKGA